MLYFINFLPIYISGTEKPLESEESPVMAIKQHPLSIQLEAETALLHPLCQNSYCQIGFITGMDDRKMASNGY